MVSMQISYIFGFFDVILPVNVWVVKILSINTKRFFSLPSNDHRQLPLLSMMWGHALWRFPANPSSWNQLVMFEFSPTLTVFHSRHFGFESGVVTTTILPTNYLSLTQRQPINMADVNCTNNEERLTQCEYVFENTCTHM